MVVGIKDAVKLIAISIIVCCAVIVCTMFLNFYWDALLIKDMILMKEALIFYEAQLLGAKLTCFISGGCLLITTIVMLIFYIKHYIDTHKKSLGILKALGYANLKIAKNFWVFGISVFIGAFIGFCGAFLIMPSFYKLQNKEDILPEITMGFHPSLFVYLVIIPTVFFSLLAISYACIALRKPPLQLLKDSLQMNAKVTAHKSKHFFSRKQIESSFVEDLKKSTLRNKKSLVFFTIFASFCFSSMTQMFSGMKEFSSEMMGIMVLVIGIMLACVTFLLAMQAVVAGNTKTIAMMRVLGYNQQDCRKALLDGYRPVAYIGFLLGTIYQYGLFWIMLEIVFKDVEGVSSYEFDVQMMFISLIAFIILYEFVMYVYSEKIKKISIKEIMLES